MEIFVDSQISFIYFLIIDTSSFFSVFVPDILLIFSAYFHFFLIFIRLLFFTLKINAQKSSFNLGLNLTM